MNSQLRPAFLTTKLSVFPALGLTLKADTGGSENGILALLALAHVILERGESGLCYDNNDRNVYNDHAALEHIGGIPNDAGREQRAGKHERGGYQAEDEHKRLRRVAL